MASYASGTCEDGTVSPPRVRAGTDQKKKKKYFVIVSRKSAVES